MGEWGKAVVIIVALKCRIQSGDVQSVIGSRRISNSWDGIGTGDLLANGTFAAHVLPRSAGTRLPSTGWVKVVGVHRAGLQIVRLAETVTATRDHFGAPGKCLAV